MVLYFCNSTQTDVFGPALIFIYGNADLFVIPAKAGIQCFNLLGSRLRGITSDLAHVSSRLVEWLFVSSNNETK
jgi:hypothetical protein